MAGTSPAMTNFGYRATSLRRHRRHFRMRAVAFARAGFSQGIQASRHHGIGERHAGRHAQSAADADRFAVHEAEIGHAGAGEPEDRSLHEITLTENDTE